MTTTLRLPAALGALTIAAGVLAGTAGTATASASHAAAALPKGFVGSFLQIAAVPHSSDVFGVATDQTSQGTSQLSARRHNGKWHDVPQTDGDFTAIASAGPTATWIGGSTEGDYQSPAIDHWNGSRFVKQHISVVTGTVSSIAASSAKNAWASGAMYTHAGIAAEHWNGKKWTALQVPITGQLGAIATSSATNTLVIEANYLNPGLGVLRWNGKHWKKTLSAPAHVTFTDVATTSAHDGIVVGTYTNGASQHAVVERFSAGKWHSMKIHGSYNGGTGLSALSGVGKYMWAIGLGATTDASTNTTTSNTYILASSNDGKTWKQQASPIQGTNSFADVSALSRTSAFMAGGYQASYYDSPISTFATSNGHTWNAVSSSL